MTTITYKLTSNVPYEQAVSRIRLEIGDTVEGEGVKPEGTNFTDDELLYFYTSEGSDIGRASAKACEVLTTMWAKAVKTMFGSLVDPSRVSYNYRKQAEALRAQYGQATSPAGFSIPMKQVEADE